MAETLARLNHVFLLFGTQTPPSSSDVEKPLKSSRLWRAETKIDERGVVTKLYDKILSHICFKKPVEYYLVFDMLLLMTVDGV